MQDFLSFNYFITPTVLMFFYYIGVLFLPVIAWRHKEKVRTIFTFLPNKTLFWFFIALFFMELFWRMMFEMILGYFDIHNYLYQILQQQNI